MLLLFSLLDPIGNVSLYFDLYGHGKLDLKFVLKLFLLETVDLKSGEGGRRFGGRVIKFLISFLGVLKFITPVLGATNFLVRI